MILTVSDYDQLSLMVRYVLELGDVEFHFHFFFKTPLCYVYKTHGFPKMFP